MLFFDDMSDHVGGRGLAVGIPCAAITWGYGTVESIQAAHPAVIVHNTEELLQFVVGD